MSKIRHMLTSDLTAGMAAYKKFLSDTYPGVPVTLWNTVVYESKLRTVLEQLEPERVPEVLAKGLCPWKWHCNYPGGGRTPAYVKDGWVVPVDSKHPASCFTVVQWWASMHMRNDE